MSDNTITVAQVNKFIDIHNSCLEALFLSRIIPIPLYKDLHLKEDIYNIDEIIEDHEDIYEWHTDICDRIKELCNKHKTCYFRVVY